MNILVTGGTGFVGGAFLARMNREPRYNLSAVSRIADFKFPPYVKPVIVEGLSWEADWTDAVKGIDIIVHFAARAHTMHDNEADPLKWFRLVNVEGTLNLARQAACVGTKRFIFISSIKVNGEETKPHRPYTEGDLPAPKSFYGISKLEAEYKLKNLVTETGMELVIIRPSLVYGPGVQGNLRKLISWVEVGIPLPFGAIKNKRSFVGIDNLAGLITRCLEHPAAANETFLAGDGEDLSTAELLQKVALALERKCRLIPVPQLILKLAGSLFRQEKIVQRLCGSLQVDITKARTLLDWTPSVDVGEGLRRAVTVDKRSLGNNG